MTCKQDWQMQPVPIPTRWAASVCPTNVWPEYPRPQMVRSNWCNLNGLWDFAVTVKGASAPDHYADRILVPFPLESALSGVQKSLRPNEMLWYRRRVHISPEQLHGRVLLHFGAVDYEATVYVNAKIVGSHRGGYQGFTLDITDAVHPGDNELVVRVFDPTEEGPNPHGKQNLHAQWMFYSPSSGIWQTVWIEHVPSTYIAGLKLTPNVDQNELCLEVDLNGDRPGYSVEAIVREGEHIVLRHPVYGPAALPIHRPRLWSPDDPYLYDLQLNLLKDGQVVDTVTSYFGMRKIGLSQDSAGRSRIHLNDRYIYNLGVVDQGFWPDGLYTAPSDAALKFDVQAIKALGFNTVRKHIKIEPQRWYYHCDTLGLMVWQDMPSSNNDSPEARAQFERELALNLAQLHNHPSIITWVLFNEGWGAYDQERLAKWMKQADRSRLVNGHSGPYDQLRDSQWVRHREPALLLQPLGIDGGLSRSDFQAVQLRAAMDWMSGDMSDLHFYPGPRMFAPNGDRTAVTGEHGSFGVYIEGHVWDESVQVGRGLGGSGMPPQEFLAAYANSIDKLLAMEAEGLSGSAYFELYDVEGEHQGFFTYDRAVAKVPVNEVARLNAKIVPLAKNRARVIEGFVLETADSRPQSERYEGYVREFVSGRRDLAFLARLALMASRLDHQAQAVETSDQFLALSPQPYTRQTRATIGAITQSSKAKAYEVLCNRADEVNAALGEQAAQKKIVSIVMRELVAPYFQSKQRSMGWDEFEQSASDQYGALGREAVVGARMMECLLKEDWSGFGKTYIRYFETAIARSPYSLHALSYRVYKHVNDPKAIETAIRVMKWQLTVEREWPVFGRYDPVELDTYAALLHKAGRNSEALEWQQIALELSDGRDSEIVNQLEKLKKAPHKPQNRCFESHS